MASLQDPVKHYIVQALACYDTLSEVSRAVKEEFGLEVPRQQVAAYDPEKHAGRHLSEKWAVLFHATRKRFLEDQSSIPIASQNFRLRALNRLYHNAADRGNAVLAAQLLEQASKESGGVFTNKQKIEADINHKTDPKEMTDEELAAIISAGGGSSGEGTAG